MGLSVRELSRSVAFYCDVLGATVIREPYDGDDASFSGRMAIVSLGTLGLDLIEHEGNDGGSFSPARTGLDHLSFPAGSKAEVEQWARWLATSNVEHSGVKDLADIGWMLTFSDPDGIALEIIHVDAERVRRLPLRSG